MPKCIKMMFFLFFLNYFLYQRIKMIYKHQKIINLKKNSTFKTQKQIGYKSSWINIS
jgi:hypothetical protein